MKKILALLLTVCLMVSLCACSLTDKLAEGVQQGLSDLAAQLSSPSVASETTETIETGADGVVTRTRTVTEYTYDENGNVLTSVVTTTNDDGTVFVTTETNEYDENGNITHETYETSEGYKSEDIYEYDENGNTIHSTYTSSDGFSSESTYEYDENGNQTLQRYVDSDYSSETVTIYNEDGYPIDVVNTTVQEGETIVDHTVNTYDENGMLLVSEFDENGFTTKTEYTYDENGNVTLEHFENSDGYTTDKTYTYDENGWETGWEETSSAGDHYYFKSEQDENGNTIREERLSEDGLTVSEYTYDENGNRLSDHTTSADGTVSAYYYIYDENGTQIMARDVYADSTYTFTTAYDAFGNMVQNTSDNRFADGSGSYSITTIQYVTEE